MYNITQIRKSNSTIAEYKTKIDTDLYDQLFEEFYPHNERFFKMINQDFGWNIKNNT
jgi:hypothetical protein